MATSTRRARHSGQYDAVRKWQCFAAGQGKEKNSNLLTTSSLRFSVLFDPPANFSHNIFFNTVAQGRASCSWLHFYRPILICSSGAAVASPADKLREQVRVAGFFFFWNYGCLCMLEYGNVHNILARDTGPCMYQSIQFSVHKKQIQLLWVRILGGKQAKPAWDWLRRHPSSEGQANRIGLNVAGGPSMFLIRLDLFVWNLGAKLLHRISDWSVSGAATSELFGKPRSRRARPSSPSTAQPARPLFFSPPYIPGDLTSHSHILLRCASPVFIAPPIASTSQTPNPHRRKQWLPPPRVRSSPAKVTWLILSCSIFFRIGGGSVPVSFAPPTMFDLIWRGEI